MKASGEESEMQTLLHSQEGRAFREPAHTDAAYLAIPAVVPFATAVRKSTPAHH
jgi:hypothetical protein